MKRLAKVALAASLYVVVWFLFMIGILPVVSKTSSAGVVFSYSPIYLLMSFACYSLAVISWEMINFRDCPEKAAELKKEIEMARADLKSKGMKF
jgi:dolichyl-phosphate mannosyltransferase polypeptide 3